MNINKYIIAFAIIFSSFAVEKIYAQTSEASEYTVEEILVTARKRTESIQDVPVAVSALSISQIERGNIQRVQDLFLMLKCQTWPLQVALLVLVLEV